MFGTKVIYLCKANDPQYINNPCDFCDVSQKKKDVTIQLTVSQIFV